MIRRTGRDVSIVLLTTCSLLLTACTTTKASHGDQCRLSAKLVPECGALWGVTTEQPTNAALVAVEHSLGRRFDLVYRFHDINDTIPDTADKRAVAHGRALHVSIESTDFSSPSATAGTWAAVAAGTYDDDLHKQAEGIAALKSPVFVTFDHETDQPAREALGSAQEFIAAWRHVHDVYTKAGATNAVWVWVILGWAPSFDRAATLWPGNAYVDWISWDVYNQSGCRGGQVDPSLYTSFSNDVRLVYDWVHGVGPTIGMDPNKPMMISEAGSVLYRDDPEKTAQWYAEIPSVLEDYPQVKAVSLWDHTGHVICDYRIGLDPKVLETVTDVGHTGWLNQREGD